MISNLWSTKITVDIIFNNLTIKDQRDFGAIFFSMILRKKPKQDSSVWL